jgi:hypothetical protein
MKAFLIFCLSVVLTMDARAHLGSPFIIFEGKAGEFPIQVVVRQPEVVPGLADISVSVLKGLPKRVTVLPLYHNAKREDAPRPDVATPVPGSTNLFTAGLWFMARGAYAVEVRIEGEGEGRAIIPVNSIANSQKPMPQWMGWTLAGLACVLIIGFISIVASSACQGALAPGMIPTTGQKIRAWIGGLLATSLCALALRGGTRWWNLVDLEHAEKVVFHPSPNVISISQSNATAILNLKLPVHSPTRRSNWGPLIPDHGKLVHLFLIGTPTSQEEIPTFAHLHPIRQGEEDYIASLPHLAPGRYQVFADLIHEIGLTETITNVVDISTDSAQAYLPSDPDDSSLPAQSPAPVVALGDGLQMEISRNSFTPGVPSTIRAKIADSSGTAVTLEPFLRMLGHAAIERADGQVFVHLHPAGTLSMAAARHFAIKYGREADAQASDANCGDLSAIPPSTAESLVRGGEVSFPVVFPSSGNYRLWVQVRAAGAIRTGAFGITVSD